MTRVRLVMLWGLLTSMAALAQHDRHGAPLLVVPPQTSMPLHMGSNPDRLPLLKTWVQGWALTGSRPDAYEVKCDDVTSDCGAPILRTRALTTEPFGTGALTHTESAVAWRGRRVELKGELRAGRIDGWAGLWVRVDGKDGQVLAFDNMQNRPLKGTGGYAWYSVVLDVPTHAEKLFFGVLLHGPGGVWVRELQFNEAPVEAATTDLVGPLRTQLQQP